MTDTLHISPSDLAPAGAKAAARDARFDRFKLIAWWDQQRLARARVLVAGAGALGNEIVKNLALLGVGHVLVADMDRIENSNLSRSVLYRASDNGNYKATVASDAAREISKDGSQIVGGVDCADVGHEHSAYGLTPSGLRADGER